MIKNIIITIGSLLSILLFICCGTSEEVELFDGQTLEGWEGSNTVFRVEQRSIVGGNLEKPLKNTSYLCTTEQYENFELTLEARFITNTLKVNGGISFRAKRVPDSNEVMGYQADMGYIDASAFLLFSDFMPADTLGTYPLWGSLVDENRTDTSRYPKPDIFPVIIYRVADSELIDDIINPFGWNTVSIRANGPDIEIKINGVTTAKFTETSNVPTTGCICLQAHWAEPYEVWYKNIVLKPL